MEYSSRQLNELYKKLPWDLKDALFSEASANSIRAIGEKYNFQIKKIGILADETGLVLFGVLHPKDFIPDLAQKLGVDKEVAKKIAEDVNREIFQKVRVSLRKLHGITDEEPITKKQETTIPIPVPPLPTPQAVGAKPPKIVITEKIDIPKEAPKEELKPLEIRPIKGGPLEEPEKTPTPPGAGAPTASVEVSPRPQLDFPPRRSQEPERDMGLKIMPHSPEQVGIKKIPKPPSGMAFIAEKKLEPPHPSPPPSSQTPEGQRKASEGTAKPPDPPKPSYDQYRERI
ncbi:hypothetical protein A2Z63_02435 [Candidatus Giovannonibacteria bacterium RIFCSPLOWO2_02_44_8]|uniref:Uncharacterized protein n=1 Tax=Candidatus Giovannonibacteria bacterium RIFCSPLOWO2_02_44_8 TaxID=1798355 RepID=A0A1F5XCT6_9BACT|nr:MAG: hypothetical protein A2Z63_02435 [Candidatus Giovannonibacteria bacterium RIFCSPLOWO2_02_44_8]